VAGGNERLRWAETGAYVVAVAGLIALVTIAVAPGRLYPVSLAGLGLALAPVMLGFYELGGRTPLTPARLSLAIGIGATVVWSVILIALAAGVVSFDESKPATGAFAIAAVASTVFGAWLVGAPALAGTWLPTGARLLGVACGLAWAVSGVGLLLGGASHPLAYLSGIGYTFLFPIWGLVMGRRFAALRSGRP
jgi:hypothetical protein